MPRRSELGDLKPEEFRDEDESVNPTEHGDFLTVVAQPFTIDVATTPMRNEQGYLAMFDFSNPQEKNMNFLIMLESSTPIPTDRLALLISMYCRDGRFLAMVESMLQHTRGKNRRKRLTYEELKPRQRLRLHLDIMNSLIGLIEKKYQIETKFHLLKSMDGILDTATL